MRLFRPNQHCYVVVLVNYIVFLPGIIHPAMLFAYGIAYDAKSLNPRKWMSEEQLFSLPLGFILYERQLEMLC